MSQQFRSSVPSLSRKFSTLPVRSTEPPHCYKRLPQVLAAHGSTIRILHMLTPLGVAISGANDFDPYKD